jgi:hypothetical protein
VFENRVLRKILGHKQEEVVRHWRRVHNEELHKLSSLSYMVRVIKSRKLRWVRYVVCMMQMRNTYKILVRKPKKKRLLGKHRCRREDNNK